MWWRDDPRAAPLRAHDEALEGLPPTLVITAELDPLRDEGEAYGRRLQSVGVETTVLRFDGMIHGFYAMRDLFPDAATAIDRSAGFLRGTLGSASLVDGFQPAGSRAGAAGSHSSRYQL